MANKKYEALYQSISSDIQKMKEELAKEIGYSTAQIGALYSAMQEEGVMDVTKELRYCNKQNERIYTGLESVMTEQLGEKLTALERVENELNELKSNYQQLQAAYENLANKPFSVHTQSDIDYERIADLVAQKIAAKEQHYEVVFDEEGIDKLAQKVADCITKKEKEEGYDLLLDEESVQALSDGVAQRLCGMCASCALATETEEEPVETPVEEQTEEPAEVESAAENAEDELAVAVAPMEDDFLADELVDAETGLVVRLKKSFTAKMKQSDEAVKAYYSDIKNELTSYKKLNSNVSWHGDRFNLGRDTVAKVNICGKTLCLYLALDPADPEFKQTIYHQKDVGEKKAYESTPFMIKIKSEAAAKKAVRLIGVLAEKFAAEKKANFKATDYVEEFAYATTKQLFDEGFIKATKEKKVSLDF